MITTKILYLAAENFLCFGPNGIELRLDHYGNIVLIRGNNLDVQDDEERIASNGIGKSSIFEILVYTLFGQTIKQPKKIRHQDVINNQIGKKLRTEVRLDNYRIVRTRKPDSLRVWESEGADWSGLGNEEWEKAHEISLGGIPATQKLIEEKIGLNYNAFVNIAVFTDNNSGSFLECETPIKRQIVESLLSLEKYKEYAEVAKVFCKKLKNKLKEIGKEYTDLLNQLQNCMNREKQILTQRELWIEEKKKEVKVLTQRIEEHRKTLESSEEGQTLVKYDLAQDRINELIKLIPDIQAKKHKLDEIIQQAQDKLETQRETKHKVNSSIFAHQSKVENEENEVIKLTKEIEHLAKHKGGQCEFCDGIITEENYKSYSAKRLEKIEQHKKQGLIHQDSLLEHKKKMEIIDSSIGKLVDGIETAKKNAKTILATISKYQNELTQLNQLEKPTTQDVRNAVLEEQIDNLKKQIADKTAELEGPTPHDLFLSSTKNEINTKKQECIDKKKELEESEEELPYYEFWSIGFGDSGIRKFVIDDIIPTLNSRVAHWMQFLIDGKIKLEFDNELEETICRNPSDGDPFVYPQMSGGEKRRLNLAVQNGFAHVMMLNTGKMLSCVFLDEVTTNIDPVGVVGIYNMIVELAKERQVFITTHDQDLLDMLEGCETILLEKKSGFSRVLNTKGD
jgi:DNA repair exonuclease SbcCD ATPase subunit